MFQALKIKWVKDFKLRHGLILAIESHNFRSGRDIGNNCHLPHFTDEETGLEQWIVCLRTHSLENAEEGQNPDILPSSPEVS